MERNPTDRDPLAELELYIRALRKLKPHSRALRFFQEPHERIDTRPGSRISEPLPN